MGRRRRRSPAPSGPSAEEAAAQARAEARADAEKAAADNRQMWTAMQAQADAERKRSEEIARTPAPSKVGATVGSTASGISRRKQYLKERRRKKAADLRIQLADAASPMGGTGGQGGQPTV